ncbi:hypothetical protein [Paraburkholderia terrae]|uniref:hypothetical protein n=1 Tax=Paraburkholderia terrae TaxID=311230 RepID=UPI001EE25111|nr:hypothetical protein [Paraburkholderia terrae]GJH05021.1 hypothetical protein CBA19C8_30710 [Paraburkholderia terrae]
MLIDVTATNKARGNIHGMMRNGKYSGETMTFDESEQIEELLSTWYRWQIRESNNDVFSHWYRPADHTCRGYVTPTREDEDDEAVQQGVGDMQSEQVQLCIDLLTVEQRAAISVSMLNKDAGHTVWRSGRAGDQHMTYQAAKTRLLPMFVQRGLVKRADAPSAPSELHAGDIDEIRRLIAASMTFPKNML